MEYQRIGAWWLSPVVSTDACFFFWGGAGVQESVPVGGCWVVFGTLLGPEATGPGVAAAFGRGGVPGLFVSGFPGCIERARRCVGCVVWGCCLRTT